jgi:hypothetical protein
LTGGWSQLVAGVNTTSNCIKPTRIVSASIAMGASMPNAADMKWFKENFHAEIEAAIAGTPFTLDLMVALACQETGDVWPILRKKPLTVDQIVALCVGDTIDFNPATRKGRQAFPRNKAALLAVPRGDEMFAIARQALLDILSLDFRCRTRSSSAAATACSSWTCNSSRMIRTTSSKNATRNSVRRSADASVS